MVFLAQCLGTRLLGRFLPKLEPRLRAGAFFLENPGGHAPAVQTQSSMIVILDNTDTLEPSRLPMTGWET